MSDSSDIQRFMASALESEEWTGALEAWYEALGISVLVLDPAMDVVLSAGPRAGFCDVSQGLPEGRLPFVCIPGPMKELCRGGTPFRLLPLRFEDEIVARIVVCGYVTSAGERQAVAARLKERGIPDGEVRAIVRGVPVIPKRRLAAVEEMVLHQAKALLHRAQVEASRREDAVLLEAVAAAMRKSDESAQDPKVMAGWMLQHAVRISGASGGSIALADGAGGLTVVGQEGDGLPSGPGMLQRTFRSGRTSIGTVPAAEGEGRSFACVPLVAGDCRLGVVCVTVGGVDLTVPLANLERFATLSSVVLDGLMLRQSRDREICELMHISEVARTLHQGVEVNDIAPVVAGLLEKALDFGIGGVALTGYGTDRVASVVRGQVTAREIAEVAAEATGRDTVEEMNVETASYLGEIVEETGTHRDWTVLSQPLAVDDKVIGYLFAARSAPAGFDFEDERLLDRLAAHVAVAFNRSALFARLRDDYTRTVEVLSAALDAGEGMQRGHSGLVMEYAMRIGEEMGLPVEDVEVLRFAGLVHDIGKIGVSGKLLLKPARLNDEEMAEVKRHSEIGASLLEQVGFLNSVAPVVLHHHEHWDGTGYPMGLSGEDIPLLARILAAADAFASMIADTPYRSAMTARRASSEILAASGSQFDPRVVAALAGVLDSMHVAGLSGLLNAGDAGTSESLPA